LIKLFIFTAAAAILLTGCEKGKLSFRSSEADSIRTVLLQQADSIERFIEIKPVTYSPVTKTNYAKLLKEYGEAAAGIILKLNRIDKNHVRAKDTLIVPDTTLNNLLYYSPFPLSLQAAADLPRLLFVSQTIQAFGAYEYGVLVKWGPASTGKPSTPTPNGLFHTNWKAEESISTFNDEWLLRWNFNIESLEGIAIHQYDMPGYPASHACARLLEEDAMWFYNWADQWIVTPDESDIAAHGNPVIIFGEYDFKGRKPWLLLYDDHNANNISRNELEEILSPYLDTIQQRQNQRDSILAQYDTM
jgi:lipoprotein-anchoring transpeptidase ErfK/SrfK